MFRDNDQRNNLVLLLTSVLLLLFKKEVHQNIFETMMGTGLLTNRGCHGYSVVNKW